MIGNLKRQGKNKMVRIMIKFIIFKQLKFFWTMGNLSKD